MNVNFWNLLISYKHMPKSKRFIVIPAYNEEKHIAGVLKEALSSKLPVILVDDGSRDKTYEMAKKVAVDAIRHEVNLGKGAALKTGCEAAFEKGAQAIIVMDSDGQHKAEDLPKFIKALEGGCEVVFGSRNLNYGVPLVRYLGNKFASVLISLLFGIYVSDLICGFRAFTKEAYKKIEWESTGYGVETEVVINTARANLKHCEVPVQTVYLDGVKGVTILDALGILWDVLRWRLSK